MKYENPSMELLEWEAEDVITLSIDNDADQTIEPNDSGNYPWAS